MGKKEYWMLLIFALFLILLSVFSTRIDFHDTNEYITIAKHFAGIDNVDLFSGHSLFYPLVISFFLRVWHSFIMLRLINALWVFLIGALLLLWIRNRKAFLLFAFSPLTWWVSMQTTPVLPASFFFLLGFIFFMKDKIRYNRLYSGICMGLAFAFYTPMLIVAGCFMLVYFWDRNFADFFMYLIAFGIGFLPGMIQDYYLFKLPVYSMIRYAGANVLISMGARSDVKDFGMLTNLWFLGILFIISPFLFKLYKTEFKKYRRLIIFLVLVLLIFLIRINDLTYFLILSPLILLLLSSQLSEKEIKWNSIISLAIIIFMIWSFFGINEEMLIKEDLQKIQEEFNPKYVITGPFAAIALASVSWDDNPRFIWFEDYLAYVHNNSMLKSPGIGISPRIPLRSNMEIRFNFYRSNNRDYSDAILVLRDSEYDMLTDYKEVEDFKLNKCYKILCVFEK